MTDAPASIPLPALGLQSVAIRGFRCLENTGPLPFHVGMTVLAGENGGGKSSCLDAIEFLLSDRTLDADDRTNGESQEIVVEGVFAPVGETNSSSTVFVRARQPYGSSRVTEVKDWVHPAFGGRPEQLTVPDLKAALDKVGAKVPKGTLKPQLVALAEEWIAGQPKDDLTPTWRTITVEERQRLPRLTRFSSAGASEPISAVQTIVTREARRLIADPLFSVPLGQIAADLDRAIQPSLDLVRETVYQHCPDLDQVDIGALFDFSRVTPTATWHISMRQMHLSVAKLGQGRVRRIAIAVHEALAQVMAREDNGANEILLYDEPDSHLDVTSQRRLFDILNRQSALPHVQVAIATHSKHLIDLVPLTALLHFTLDENFSTMVTTVAGTSHEEALAFHGSIYTSLGLKNSIILDERRFLMVEGDTEQIAIPILFERYTGKSIASCGVHLMNTQGASAMRPFAGMLKHQWQRDLILIADSDKREEHEKWMGHAGLEVDISAFFLGDQEFEDAFSDALWSTVLQASFPFKDPDECWVAADIAAIRARGGKFSEDLRNTVSRRRRQGIVSKPDLGQALAVACPLDQIPAPLITCFDRIVKPVPVAAAPALA